VTPNDIAVSFSTILGRPVRMQASAQTWEALFKSQDEIRVPRHADAGRLQRRLDSRLKGSTGSRKGTTTLHTVLEGLVDLRQIPAFETGLRQKRIPDP